jgi:hypothetical protein
VKGEKKLDFQKQFIEYTTQAEFVMYHLKSKTQVKHNISCSKHDVCKAQCSNLLVKVVDFVLYACVVQERSLLLILFNVVTNNDINWWT